MDKIRELAQALTDSASAKEKNKTILMVLLNNPVFLILLITVCPFFSWYDKNS